MSKFVAGIYFFYETKKIYKKINIPSILKRMMVLILPFVLLKGT